jgi:hypothetical protein
VSLPPPVEKVPVVVPARPKPILLSVQLRNQRKWNEDRLNRAFLRNRPTRFFDFLTAGTSNRRPEELVDTMKREVFSCKRLVDVRSNPNSRHTPYWNKNQISNLLRDRGIDYLHKPELGVPTSIRKQLNSGSISYTEFFSWYDSNVLSQASLDEVANLVQNSSLVFLCTEVGPEFCHRHRIALKLESLFGYISYDL